MRVCFLLPSLPVLSPFVAAVHSLRSLVLEMLKLEQAMILFVEVDRGDRPSRSNVNAYLCLHKLDPCHKSRGVLYLRL